MSKVLYIKANPNPEEKSFSALVGRTFLDYYRGKKPGDEVIELDLYEMNIPLIDGNVLSGWEKLRQGSRFDDFSLKEMIQTTSINKLTEQFIHADKYIFVSPLWNLGIPPLLKAYIDAVCIVDRSFKYTEKGPVGLLKGKKAIHIQARGGVFSEGPAKEYELGDRYIRTILNFMGVQVADSVIIEGVHQAPEQIDAIKARAMEQARKAATIFAQ
ncbi:FMN-dependent NADH-azoreductase [Desulfocucumis palustris]|uniref:FMN dependent NADH:quinone oxidoreductase n=1 Tax=Desulfocucumis palustris TaxID=1898651 RepID=A0A2L2XC20_9FIRM|nr:FMN-dependent NADH-azoreductase [Desulfocucumis palustris]GBF33642.1 FMN-dependent NADH-azoreductase [Desulfocucumis palustris]